MTKYKRLPYEQYFIDTSNDYGNTKKARKAIPYVRKYYTYKGIKFTANYFIDYDESRNVIQVYFEDTEGKLDWLTNFMFIDKYYDIFETIIDGKKVKIDLRIHNGWAAMYKAVKHEIRNGVAELLSKHADAYVEIIGWSLGSGQAMICAQDLNYNLGIRPYVYTYGSVNPFKTNIFNRKNIHKYLMNCCKVVCNFYDVNDIVGYVPLNFFGFRKINGVKVKQDRFNIFRLFKPKKYHTEYWKEDLYKNNRYLKTRG